MGVGSSRLGHSLLINWGIAVAGTFDAVKKINDNVVWGLVAKVLSSFKGNDLKRLKDAMGHYWEGRSAHSPTRVRV